MSKVVLYHDDADGFGAAYAIWCCDKFNPGSPERVYIPVNYGEPVPELPEDTHSLTIVDFSYSREICDQLSAKYRDFLVIDHHKTAQAELVDASYAVFDQTKSGAVLTWHYFNPSLAIPAILHYVQDRDLWQWRLPYSEEVNLHIHTLPRDFHAWYQFDLTEAKVAGAAIKRYKDILLEEIAKKAFLTTYDGYKVVSVHTPVLTSEVGNLLCRRYPDAAFAILVSIVDPGGKTKISLRSAGDFDVSAVAKAHGGGGHKNAAGFEC